MRRWPSSWLTSWRDMYCIVLYCIVLYCFRADQDEEVAKQVADELERQERDVLYCIVLYCFQGGPG